MDRAGSVIGNVSLTGGHNFFSAMGGDPAHPHPDRFYEMAGCSGGPGCVLPEGFEGTYGEYRALAGEEAFGELLLLLIPLPIPTKLLALGKAVEAIRGGKAGKAAANACKPHSFLPGTAVLMADGTTKPIEQVKIGDRVLATNPSDGTTEAQTVTDVIVGEGMKSLVEITVEEQQWSGRRKQGRVTATDKHPFYEQLSRSWVDAGDLRPGNKLVARAEAITATVTSVRHRQAITRVHNLTVANTHTYYVLAGRTPVLVHNSDCFTAPASRLNRHGELTNGKYTVSSDAMAKHLPTTAGQGKSVFLTGVDAEKAVLDAAAYADANGLWVGDKAKVFVQNGPVGILGKNGELTQYLNVYRNARGGVHGSTGGAR
ncbi:polymorphic toxin-type HINT domain-containing protein [Kribbella catacumbae]|uniref:polymorphic toxin-type HINT domain-containing protein n=1 Tax=Kribbella catacumbae TaxID=460086 RepID=UPI0012F710B5|nr:polymorphic toxin-type HINT domain-containing protein [Kribbella catacumbae]